MSIYCDEEMDIHLMESGYRMSSDEPQSDAEICPYLPDDVVSILADYSCEYLTDQLTFSLLSSQHQRVMVDKLRNVGSQSGASSHSAFQLSNFADYFTSWSLIRFGGTAAFVTDVPSSQSALSFYCKSCHSLIITQNEVESPHYHGGYGPAFLAHCVFNCHHSADEAYETQFTTGVYRVCDVTCRKCSSRVGKKYVEARDPANYFKVGKILLEQTLLTMPKCCNNRKLNAFPPEHYFCSRESGVSCFCSVCLEVARSTAAAAVMEMTNSLDAKLTVKLLSYLITERQLLTCTPEDPTPTPQHGCDEMSPSISRRFGDVISRFVRRSISSSGNGSATPSASGFMSPRDSIELGSPINAAMNAVITTPPTTSHKLTSEQLYYLSHSIGSRAAMIPDCQNWIVSTKFISDLIAAAGKQGNPGSAVHLNRVGMLEGLLSQCGPVSFHSVTLLLSRVQNLDDRRAVVTGVGRNAKSLLSHDEYEGLSGLAGGASPASTPGRWSFSAQGQNSHAMFSAYR